MPNSPSNQLNRFSQNYRRYFDYIQPVVSDPLVRGYFSLVASLILITVLVIFAISPTINVILGLRKKIADQQTTISSLTTKVGALTTAQETYGQIEPDLWLLDSALPVLPEPQIVIRDVDTAATTSGVVITSFQLQTISLSRTLPLGKAHPLGLPFLGFSLSVSGTESRVRAFLGQIENEVRYIRIDNLALSRSKEKGTVTIDMSGAAFFFR